MDAHVMAEGYLSEAWRLLGEGLGPYVYKKTGDQELSNTRDVYVILQKMVASGNWNQYFKSLGHRERSWASELFALRNESWAHQGNYSDEDIHHCLGVMVRLLRSISAAEQADSVAESYETVGRLIYGQRSVGDSESPSQDILALLEGMGREDFAEILRRGISTISRPQSLSSNYDSGGIVDTDEVDLDGVKDVVYYIRRGEMCLKDDKNEQAIEEFSAAIESFPENPRGYRARGNVYARNESMA